MHFKPARAKAAVACNSSVDLPMPGSPPTKMADAATNPPPKTRSSSAMPEAARGGASACVARSVSAIVRPLATGPLGPADRGDSSTKVFHAMQASHWPFHFLWLAPQAVQVKVFEDLLIPLHARP